LTKIWWFIFNGELKVQHICVLHPKVAPIEKLSQLKEILESSPPLTKGIKISYKENIKLQ
jgi:hypothetical protein